MHPARRHRGQSVVEFALILPLLITFSMSGLDFGRYFFYRVQFENGVHEAARYAAQHSNVTSRALQSIIAGASGNAIASTDITNVDVEQSTGSAGESIETVTATYTFHFISPWFTSWLGIANPLASTTSVAAAVGQ